MLLDLFELLSRTCVAAASVGCLYLLIASVAVLRFPQLRLPARGGRAEPVSVLKPLRGAEPNLLARVRSFCVQHYDAPIQVICGVQDARDPVIEVIEDLRERYGGIEINIDASDSGGNPKISNLRSMAPLAVHENLLIADSDIEVGPEFLKRVFAELQRPGVGAVTCLYHGVPDGGGWSRQSALGINSHFLPNVVLAVSFDLIRPCFGSAIALRKSTLNGIGGFGVFADCLADDFAIGQAVRMRGYEIAIPEFSIGHVCYEPSLRALFARELRAARTIRGIDPIGYCGALIAHPFPLALLAAIFGSTHALLLALLALGCRGALCLCVESRFGLARQSYHLIPLRDVISFAVHVTGLVGNTVSWRGSTYSVNWDGRIVSGPN